MIVKRQPDRDNRDSDFQRLAEYIFRTHKKENKQDIAGFRISNCGFSKDPALAIKEILNTQAFNTRAKSDPSYHMVFSFPPGEKPSLETITAIEDELCRAIGFEDHQRLSAIHDDTDHYHVHVAINKIHPLMHTIREPYYDKIQLIETAERLEIEHDLVKQINWEQARVRREQGISTTDQTLETMKAHTGQMPFKDWIIPRQAIITEAIDQAESWQDLHKSLASLDLEIKKHGNGAALCSRSTIKKIKLSTLGRAYTKAKLEKRLGHIQPPAPEIAAIKPQTRYNMPPLHKPAAKSPLFDAYSRRKKAKTLALSTLRQRRIAALRHLKQLHTRQSAEIRTDPLLNGANKRHAWKGLAETSRRARTTVHQKFKAEQQAIYQQFPERSWQDYLINLAENSNPEALDLLRKSRPAKSLRNQLALTGEQRRQGDNLFAALQSTVNKNGIVTYQHKNITIRDDGQQLATNSHDKAAILALLRLARHKYGDHLKLLGSDEAFKQAVVEVAVSEKMTITFTDPAMERKRKALAAALQEKSRPARKNQDRQRERERERGHER